MDRLGRADLHVHTHWSDGRQSPEAIVLAAAGRVDVLAVTDHDEIAGALLARRLAHARPELGLEVVVGEESARRDADALRRALVAGRTHAHLNWAWTLGRLPGHIRLKCVDAVRFVRLAISRRREAAAVTRHMSGAACRATFTVTSSTRNARPLGSATT